MPFLLAASKHAFLLITVRSSSGRSNTQQTGWLVRLPDKSSLALLQGKRIT
jgi:hypothetical protein